MTLDQQSFGPDVARLRSVRLLDGVATLVADATGLGEGERTELEARLKAAALAQPGVTEVRVAMTASKAAGPKLIAVGSGKGGVGKSTVSVNLAIALARLGHKVGIIDADIYGPSQPTLLGTSERPEARDKQLIPVEAQGVKLLSVGQLVSPGHALAWRGPMASGALAQLVEGDWSGTELIIVDLPPGTGDVQLSLIQKSRPVGAVVVSTPQDLALIDARRAIDLFGKTSVPVLGIIENMAGYQCPHCGETSDPFGSGGAEAAAAELGVPFLGRLPLSASLRAESDAGRPPAAGDGPAAAAFRTLAEAVLAQLA
ncbi:Mrp/NBP35 family ATP-binding protein [Sphingomonas glaciei]|uniref:Iron-sulfur cluster carrier protein n=2 Tax=Sphingomonas glaciei TaxID=2938948 RepID=A0ABY5N4K0_9SPHN|nr:Mrp/NBP35 family ATP-binding protein [Sphingomonas glaciei]UUR09481.1 Mrp/NBP35 family ATP-binding protein [Sphingomonas glaciei]